MFGFTRGRQFNRVSKINHDLLHLGLHMHVAYPDGRFIHNHDLNEIVRVCQYIQDGQYQQATRFAHSDFGILTQTKMISLINNPQFFQKALPLIKYKVSLVQTPIIEKKDAKIRKYQYKIAKHSKHHTPRQRDLVEYYQNKIEDLKQEKNHTYQI